MLGPGGYIVKPHGEVHAMWNAGDTPARMIEVITPAGLERAFRAWADALAPAFVTGTVDRADLPGVFASAAASAGSCLPDGVPVGGCPAR